MGGAESWVLYTAPNQDAENDSATSQLIVRLQITLPPDLAKAEPNSIKVTVLGTQEVIGTPLHASPGGLFGISAGREVSPGVRRIYFSDWAGRILTATPIP
jgi:hypothetical protein